MAPEGSEMFGFVAENTSADVLGLFEEEQQRLVRVQAFQGRIHQGKRPECAQSKVQMA